MLLSAHNTTEIDCKVVVDINRGSKAMGSFLIAYSRAMNKRHMRLMLNCIISFVARSEIGSMVGDQLHILSDCNMLLSSR